MAEYRDLMEQLDDDEGWFEPEDTFIRFENVGDMITGLYLEDEIMIVKGEDQHRYGVGVPDGEGELVINRFLGSTNLNSKMANVSLGSLVRIEVIGLTEERYFGKQARLFSVKSKPREDAI